jgi:4-carboxymuconolactone decarboxylase
LFADVLERQELSPRDHSLITVSSLITGGNTEQLGLHLNKAKENGLSEEELIEVITHLAFCCFQKKIKNQIFKVIYRKGVI